MKKKAFLFAALAIPVAYTILSIFTGKERERDNEATMRLPELVADIAKGPEVDFDTYDVDPELWDPADFDGAVYLQRYSTLDGYNYGYKERVNKLLGTEELVPGEIMDGVIVANITHEAMGEFPNGSTADRIDYDIYFIKLPEKVIVNFVCVMGGDPPMKVKVTQTDGTSGSRPSAKEIAGAIQAELGR